MTDTNNSNVVKRITNMTTEDLEKCYVLYDTYWDDGLDDERTLQNIKNFVLGIPACPICGGIDNTSEEM